MTDSKRTAMTVADEAHERIERLNTWMTVLHRRLKVVEQRLGIEGVPTELTDDLLIEPTEEGPGF